MRVCINFCENCGVEYKFQASGNYWSLDTEEKYNDFKHCSECKKAIIEALIKIPKKTELRYIDTNEYSLDEYFLKDKEYVESFKNENNMFPIARRVFSGLVKDDFSDSTYTSEIKINGQKYIYSYWGNSKEFIKATKQVRWDLINDKIYGN